MYRTVQQDTSESCGGALNLCNDMADSVMTRRTEHWTVTEKIQVLFLALPLTYWEIAGMLLQFLSSHCSLQISCLSIWASETITITLCEVNWWEIEMMIFTIRFSVVECFCWPDKL